MKPPIQELHLILKTTTIVAASLVLGKQYISDIKNWVTESVDSPASMYWMKGPAGVGKSAIAQTCAEMLDILVLHFSSLSRNTTIPYVCSLPSLSNLLLRFLIIMTLSMRGSPRIEVLLGRKYQLNSDH